MRTSRSNVRLHLGVICQENRWLESSWKVLTFIPKRVLMQSLAKYISNIGINFWNKKNWSNWPKNFFGCLVFRCLCDHQYIFDETLTTFSVFLNSSMCYESKMMVYETEIILQKCWNTSKIVKFGIFWKFLCIPFSKFNICVYNDAIKHLRNKNKIWSSLLGVLSQSTLLGK